jgi:hypothetical protein
MMTEINYYDSRKIGSLKFAGSGIRNTEEGKQKTGVRIQEPCNMTKRIRRGAVIVRQ